MVIPPPLAPRRTHEHEYMITSHRLAEHGPSHVLRTCVHCGDTHRLTEYNKTPYWRWVFVPGEKWIVKVEEEKIDG